MYKYCNNVMYEYKRRYERTDQRDKRKSGVGYFIQRATVLDSTTFDTLGKTALEKGGGGGPNLHSGGMAAAPHKKGRTLEKALYKCQYQHQ